MPIVTNMREMPRPGLLVLMEFRVIRSFGKFRRACLLASLLCLSLCTESPLFAEDDAASLKQTVEEQGRQIERLTRALEEMSAKQNRASLEPSLPITGPMLESTTAEEPPTLSVGDSETLGVDAKLTLSETAKDDIRLQTAVDEYVKKHPTLFSKPGLSSGYDINKGLFFKKDPDEKSKLAFELDLRGRLQIDFYSFNTLYNHNYQTQAPAYASGNAEALPDLDTLAVKRARLLFQGYAFTPNIRYQYQIDGSTRGVAGFQNNRDVQTTGSFAPNGNAVSPVGGGVTLDHVLRFFSGYIAYDIRGPKRQIPYGPDCLGNGGESEYQSTTSLIVGKLKPFFSFEEVLTSQFCQFVDYSMVEWYFDADDDNYIPAAGFDIKAFDDRFYSRIYATNGGDSLSPATLLDNFPGFNAGFWYDLGGEWDCEKNKLILYGEGVSDLEHHQCPVARVGLATNIVPMNSRSIYGDSEAGRIWVMPGSPGGMRLVNLLNGGTTPAATAGRYGLDKFTANSFEAFYAVKYRGLSFMNDWWVRNLSDLRSTDRGGRNSIVYIDPVTNANALFPYGRTLVDFGSNFQGGIFVIPKRLELVGRWAWVMGNSGDAHGNGNVVNTVNLPTLAGVQVLQNPFKEFRMANEYTVGMNVFFYGHNLKWQTDVGAYTGGAPAGGGQSAAGFIAGQDGWLVRTQVQLYF